MCTHVRLQCDHMTVGGMRLTTKDTLMLFRALRLVSPARLSRVRVWPARLPLDVAA